MAAPAATAAPAQAQQQQRGGKNAPAPVVPFTRASDEHWEPCALDYSAALSSSSAVGPINLEVPASGYLRGVLLRVDASGGAGTGVVAKADAPWSVIQSVDLSDVAGSPLLDAMSGYELMLVNKYGGYAFFPDPALTQEYAAIAATGGGFSFMLRLPVEISAREALGALPNMNAAQQFRSRLRQDASGAVYGTPPSTLPTVRYRATMEGWTAPQTGETPPALGTVQQWSKQVYNISPGGQTIRLQRVGNALRNLIFIARDASGVRVDSLLPDDLTVAWDQRQLNITPRAVRKRLLSERYGFAASNYEAGVDVLDFTHDFDGHPGAELRDLWVPTSQATRYELQGSFGGTGTLTVLTNEVITPAGGVA